MSYIPKSEQKTGADLTGSSGTANRTYVLANDDAILANMQIVIAQAILQASVDFTLDTNTNTITFLNKVWDDQNISLDYWTDDSLSPASGDTYCNTLQTARYSGIAVEVFLENLGTGDSSEVSFDADNGNIIASSYVVKYGAVDSNSLTTLTETTHYSIDKDSGSVLLTTAGKTALGTNVLYINYTYSGKMSDTVIATFLDPASREVEKITANYWGEVRSSIQYFDGYTSGYPTTERPFGFDVPNIPEFQVDNQGLQSVTSVSFLDNTATVTSTVDSDYVQFEEDGRVILTNRTTVPYGKKNVKIIYTHGYTNPPTLVVELTALISGVMALVNISGGSYDDLTNYQLGRKSFSIGEAYVNIREVLSQMNKRIDKIKKDLGDNYGSA